MRMNIPKIKIYPLVVLIIAPLSSCVSPQHNYHHRSFNPHSIQKGGLAIIGVVTSENKNPSYRYLSWAKSFEQSVKRKKHLYPLISAIDVRQKLGINYQTVLNNYQQFNELGFTEKELLRRAKLIAKYGLVARIERNIEQDLPNKLYSVRNVKGEIIPDQSKVVLSSQRVVTVSAKVYNLNTGQLVWQNLRETAPTNQREYITYHGKSFTGALTIATLNTFANGGYKAKRPKAPSMEFALRIVLDDLAEQLPGHPPG